MEQKKKFCKKKRSIANSMLSLILVFAMVISNVQTTSGMLSTVWAAESETETPDGRAETSDLDENENDVSVGSGEESEDKEPGEDERSGETEETTQTGADEKTEETSESGKTETEAVGDSDTETETTEEETTEEESNEFLGEEDGNGEGDGDNDSVEEQVTVIMHFKNSLGWDAVAASYANHDGSKWTDSFSGNWPGIQQKKDENGYYTVEQKKSKDSGFAIIFNNNDNNQQTADIVIDASEFTSDTYERWIWIERNSDGSTQLVISAVPVVSPEISSDNKVIFRYKNDSAQTVLVAGTMNEWNDDADSKDCWKMEKNAEGIFTYTTASALAPGSYTYKFVVDGKWIRDPNNESFTSDNDQNSILTISDGNPDQNTSPEVDGNTVTFRYENSAANNVYVRGSMTNWSISEDYKMTKDADTGVHTLVTELSHGAYEYKFFYNDGKDNWYRDPKNDLITEGNDPNSIVYVQGTDEYEYTIHYYNPTVEVPTTTTGPDLHIWDKCSGDTADDYTFESISTDPEAEGKTWLTTTIHVPYPHINIIARPEGKWIDGVKETEWTYEIKKGNTAELWFVYGEGLYDKNPYIDTCKYTIHYYNPAAPNQAVSTPDLYVWGSGTGNPGKQYPFTDTLPDEANDITWLTAEVDTPYSYIGFFGKPTAGDVWTGQDSDRKYQLKNGAKEAELWYIHGVGVYDKKPGIKLESVAASMQLDSMNSAQNNVLSLILNGSEDSGAVVKSASVDASALGMSSQMKIDPELLAVSLSVRDTVAPGTYQLPVTVESIHGDKITAEASVTVTEKKESENDFDWDEAVIYFMVTDRFFDGNSGNNTANGSDDSYDTYGKDNPGLYHGGDFAGVTAKLDYLKELGVNTIWITPIVENVQGVTVEGNSDVPYYAGYHGYWASDFEKINPALGTDEEFETLINTAHQKGMKIMVDVVVNHAGYGMEDTDKFEGMLRASEDVDEKDHELGGYQAGLPDFMTEIPEVRDKIINWQVNWAKKGVDYFRVDTVQHVDDTTWMAFKNALTEANPNFKMIGEYFGAGYNSANGGRLGSGQMDSLLDFNFNEWATDFVSGKISEVENNLAGRNKTLNNTYLTGQFLSSHDEDGFKQNLINNKWTAEAAEAASYVAATLQITAKGQPVIYYGEEIGLSGNNDYPYQTNRYDFNWSELENQQSQEGSIYNHYKKMLAIRNEYSEVFAKGDRQVVKLSGADGYDVISRSYDGTTLYVGMNIKSDAQTFTIAVKSDGISGYKDLYSGAAYEVSADKTIEVTIPAAADGGTVVLVADTFISGLIAPKLTVVKGRETSLPAQLTRMSEKGEETSVNVTYSMDTVEGVTLDDTNKNITVAETFTGKTIKLTATAGDESVTFEVKVVEDKNQITLRLHYNRPDKDYTGWNVWSWREGSSGQQYEFDSDDEDGGKVVIFELEGRSTSVLNYIIRKSAAGNDWIAKDFDEDCYIDLSDILSGTVDYYVQSGEFPGTRVLGDDVLIGVKICSAVYNSSKNVIKVVTGTPITGSMDGIFTLKRSDGTEIAVTGVKVSGADKTEYELSLGADLSGMEEIVKKYSLIYDGYTYDVTMPTMYSSDEFESQYTYQGNDLGATWSADATTFKVWAPTADKVQVNLYESGTEGENDLIETLDMTKGDKGVWSAKKTGDLNGTYYTYRVEVDGTVAEACDPYARTTGVNGNRAMVINLDATNPTGWAQDRGPNVGMSYTDSVIYELHVRDFSIKENSGISDEHKGKFLGLTESGTTNGNGQPTGLDYLTDLGVTHIHLLPSYDYATVDETKLDTPQFNWGYDPKNYNVPEGSYSTDPYNGAVRVSEMKQMIKTLHDNNINVIMDVVYNHVYNADEFCFNQIVPQYFSRTNADGSYSNGSGCGNDTASERAMVKKYIVDSVNYWADEYHIDGFRFDLVGLLDTETINEVVETVHEKHPEAVFYGEGWTMNTAVSKDGYTMATQANASATPEFAYFSDTIRDLLKGENNEVSLGFVSGLQGREADMANCFRAIAWWSQSPTQIINYASCHDNYTLKDKLNATAGKTNSEADVIKMNNLAAAIYLTAEGIPLIHAGEEILRIKVDEDGNIIHNSYNSPDSVNQIKWEDLDKPEYRAVRDYYKGLIAFRKNHAALRLTSTEAVSANVKYHWIDNEVIMFVINGKDSVNGEVSDGIVIIFNATKSDKNINLYDDKYGIEKGTWNVCINDQKAGTEILSSVTDGSVSVAPISAMVLVKGETVDTDSVYGDNALQNIERLRNELRELISIYEKVEKGNYTDDSWNAFQEALVSANQVVKDTEAAQTQILSAKENLKAAYNALEVPEGVVDTGKLKTLVAAYQEIRDQGQGSYTDESWAAFTNALTEAEQILTKTDATQAEIDDAYSKLESAYNGLSRPKPNQDALKELIAEYEKLEKGNYTDESWAAFTEALEAAKAVVAKPDATQEETNQAQEALQAAYDALKVVEGAVDKGKLTALVNRCKEILEKGQGSYTAQSWETFKNALASAENVLANESATQEEIDQAYNNLSTARGGLTDIEQPEVHEGLWTKWADDSGLVLGEDGKYHITYTGKAIKPAILVFDGETQLKEKTDYTISYKDNTNASTAEKEATVTIKGKGNYSESMESKFIIDQVDMNTLDIDDLCVLMKVSDGQVQGTVALKPVVKYNGKTLKLNKDYTVAFANEGDGKIPGVYPVRVSAVNANFKNQKEIGITIADKSSAVLMSKVSVAKIANQPYEWDDTARRGKVQTPDLTVTYKGENLTKDTHYTVKYDEVHTEAGQTATITIKGNELPYVGEKKVSFKITGQALKANMVTVDVPSQGLEYTGEAQRPKVTVSTEQKPYEQYTVEYQKNTDAGKATVIVSGINGYTGTVKKTFKITAYDISQEGSLFTFGTNNKIESAIPYAKGGSKLTDENVKARFATSAGSSQNLVQGRDYTLAYKNNTKVSSEANTASVTLKGKGNFKGTIKDIPFTVEAQKLENLKGGITAGDILAKNAKKYNKVIPVITDLDGKKLKNKTDFVIDGYEVSEPKDPDGNPGIGATVTVTVTGTKETGGNYEGSISTTFRVIDNNKNISKAVVKVKEQTYTGNAIVPGKEDIESITIKIGRDTVNLQPDDYEIVGCTNNIKKGTAKMTIHGLGEYGGTKTVNFKIVAHPMNQK